jgi:Uma2 family endonuclease
MSTLPKRFFTPEEYLEIERKAEYKSEYYNGEMFARAGARQQHNLIVWNLSREFGAQLRNRPCEAYVADMRVRVSSTGLYTYPDLVVVCAEPQFLDESRDTLLNPNLIVEVLSPTTEAYDRGLKFDHYRSLATVSQYLMVSSDRVHADLYTRQADGKWVLTAADGIEGAVDLASVECRFSLASLYEKVTF